VGGLLREVRIARGESMFDNIFDNYSRKWFEM
jgi:hypothetical protein